MVSTTAAVSPLDPTGNIRIYPNPVKETLHISLGKITEHSLTLELYSVTNALIYREDIKRTGIGEAHLDVQDLVPGSYYLRIITDNVPHNFLVIVE